MTANGFGLGEEADLTAHKMKVAQIFNTPQQLHSSTSAAFLPNPCYAYVWRFMNEKT
jgi:predicted Mrr-cat superfamily restriction endonuclease